MEMLKRFEPVALVLMIIGALNWGILGITDGETNVLAEIFGTGTLTDVDLRRDRRLRADVRPKAAWSVPLGHGPHPHGV